MHVVKHVGFLVDDPGLPSKLHTKSLEGPPPLDIGQGSPPGSWLHLGGRWHPFWGLGFFADLPEKPILKTSLPPPKKKRPRETGEGSKKKLFRHQKNLFLRSKKLIRDQKTYSFRGRRSTFARPDFVAGAAL